MFKLNEINEVKLTELFTSFTPGDYNPALCLDDCWQNTKYHNCDKLAFKTRWRIHMDSIQYSDRYEEIYTQIKREGFTVPLAAKVDKGIYVLCDGHNRLTVARDLKLKSVKIYIASESIQLEDLVAMDSGKWRLGRYADTPSLLHTAMLG